MVCLGLGLGLEAQVLGFGLGLGDQVIDLGFGSEAEVLGIALRHIFQLKMCLVNSRHSSMQ